MKLDIKNGEIRQIIVGDLVLPLKKKWFFKFMELYKSQINIPFSARYHAGIFDREVIKKLAEGGCYQIHIGVESGNEFLRYNILKRKMTDAQIVEVFDACREFGISTLSYNIVGLPYENKERFLQTVKLNARIKPSRRILSVYFPYPETDLYNIAKEADFLVKEFNLKDEFYLSQPQFSHEEVLFCQRTFNPLITIYRFINKIPLIGRLLEKTLDRVYISRKFPHRPVIKMLDFLRWIYSKTKSFVGRLSPELYQFLRRKLLRS
jgi:radical SAM superfamily enzyme YgiQ (UPF0313 family)